MLDNECIDLCLFYILIFISLTRKTEGNHVQKCFSQSTSFWQKAVERVNSEKNVFNIYHV